MAEERESPEKTIECETIQSADAKDPAPPDEAKAAQDRYLRLAAEFENYKKLAQRDLDEHTKYANERLLKELLPVLDNLQRALQHTSQTDSQSDSANGVVQGVELTCKQYLDILSRFGVRPIPSVGLPFDPAVHQAVATVESKTQPPNTIVEEYERGYYLYDRVLRPATVTVAANGTEGCRDASETS